MITRSDLARQQGTSVYDQIARAIGQAILDGDMQPGDRLPSKDALAKTLNVNTLTVGRSYHLLQQQGIVELKQGSGTFIRPDARLRLASQSNQCFSTVHLVIGAKDLTGLNHDWLRIVTDLHHGLSQSMGSQVGRFTFVESFTAACLGHIADDDAVIFFHAREADAAFLQALQQRQIPVLAAWGMDSELPLPRVKYDPFQSVAMGCRYLMDCGYQRLGYIGEMGNILGTKFFEFTNTLLNAGRDFEMTHVARVRCDNPGAAFTAVHRMAIKGALPDAFFVDTDIKAMLVIEALEYANLKVPQDIGVLGYDDMPEAARFHIPLSTIHTPRIEIGQAAGKMLLEHVTQGKPLENLRIPAQLMVRASTTDATAKPRSRRSMRAARNVASRVR